MGYTPWQVSPTGRLPSFLRTAATVRDWLRARSQSSPSPSRGTHQAVWRRSTLADHPSSSCFSTACSKRSPSSNHGSVTRHGISSAMIGASNICWDARKANNSVGPQVVQPTTTTTIDDQDKGIDQIEHKTSDRSPFLLL